MLRHLLEEALEGLEGDLILTQPIGRDPDVVKQPWALAQLVRALEVAERVGVAGVIERRAAGLEERMRFRVERVVLSDRIGRTMMTMVEWMRSAMGLTGCIILLLACSSDDAPPIERDSGVRSCDDACFAAARPVGTYLVDSLTLGFSDPAGDPNIVAGMNLDGRVSARSDEETCRWMDVVSPPPDSEEGVDNVFGPAFVSVFGTNEADYAPSINDGLVLLVIDVREDDAGRYVELLVVRTEDGGPPTFSGGRIAPDQTFVLVRSLGRLAGAVEGDRTRLGPNDISMPIIPLSDARVMMAGARLYGDIGADGIDRGVIGGGFLAEDAVTPLVAVDPDTLPESLVRSVLAAAADLSPDDTGECRRVSAGWTFTAIRADLAP